MKKVKLGPQSILYPKPIYLIGANVDGKPNFMAASFCGIVNKEPPMVSVGIRYKRYTYRGVKQNGTFSVNVPSTDLVAETDYCGIASGVKDDKIKACKFTIRIHKRAGKKTYHAVGPPVGRALNIGLQIKKAKK